MRTSTRQMAGIRVPEGLMHRLIRPVPLALVVLIAGACAGASTPASSPPLATSEVTPVPQASTAPPTQAASPSVVSPSPSSSPTAFTSPMYGYSLTVPAGWSTIAAMLAWDGTGMPGHDQAEADQFVGPGSASSWFVGAPTKNDLARQVKEVIDGTAKDHGDTCPPLPSAQDAITIGGEPATLLSYDCGILINNAVAVHGGKAYVFGFRDEAVHASTDPTDRKTFIDLLKTVQFPD